VIPPGGTIYRLLVVREIFAGLFYIPMQADSTVDSMEETGAELHPHGERSAPSCPEIALALAASAVPGILFGMMPGARAAKLDPVEALRHE
jgi:hypothetical protein